MIKKYWPLLFTLYMLLIGGNFMLYNLSLPIRIAHHILVTVILARWFWKHGLPRTPMLLPVVGMMSAVTVSVVFSVDNRMAFENAWHWLINLGLFLMLIHWCRLGYINQLMAGQFATSGALSTSSIIQGILNPAMRVSGIFFITNLTGGYSAASVLPTIGWAQGIKSRLVKYALLALVAGQLLTLWLNQSRGPFISLGVAALVALAPTIWKQRKRAVLAIPIVIGVLIPLMVWGSQKAHSSGDVLRLDLWRAAGEMLITHPTGVGAGVFGQVYRQIGTLNNPDHLDIDGMTGAHNLYLNMAAELGWPGIAAGVFFLGTALHLLRRSSWNAQKLTVLAALVGILAHMLVDDYPAQNWTFLVSLYAAYLLADSKVERTTQMKTLARIAAVNLLAFGLVMLHFDRAQTYYERSLTGNPAAALEAVELDPNLRLYRMNAALMESGLEAVHQIDSTVTSHTDFATYALVNYGRYWPGHGDYSNRIYPPQPPPTNFENEPPTPPLG